MFISIIIPVKNGGAKFRRCLESLQRSTHEQWECIVVDDQSEDDSRAIAVHYGASVISNGHTTGGPARARNLGAQIARGDILFFMDADVLLHEDALSHVSSIMGASKAPAACFGSYDDCPTEPNFLSQYRNLQHHYVHQISSSEAHTFWSGCGAVHRDVFLALGGFNTAYPRPSVEDIELGYRLRASGYTIYLEKTLQVSHMKRWTARKIVVTDIRDRAIPWACLLLRIRKVHDDLNLQTTQRVSALLTLLAIGAALLSSFFSGGLVLAALGLAGVIALNYDFYAFLHRKRGLGFALRALPWHLFYFLYSAVSFGVCFMLYRVVGFPNPAPISTPLPPLAVRADIPLLQRSS